MTIDPQSWPVLSGLLDQWLDLPEDSRAAWLEGIEPSYPALMPTLCRMIEAEARASAHGLLHTLPRIDDPADSAAGAPTVFPGFNAGESIGPYRLVRELGRGGMGVVWLAERADGALERQVALKLPIVSLHNRALVDRFTRERDILAQLTHPRIARLYDAGIADRGQPFLAIEYVEGETITAHCDRRGLGLKPRLRLFLQVLDAVQYAHANLVVHRDLKPANILVTAGGDVRLLDFGIAKLLTKDEAQETELTRMGGRVLTPDYASPEQVAGNPITTASDLYSLGVNLFELLTGERPYQLRRQTRRGLEEAILADEPRRPSQAAQDPDKARARGATLKKLSRDLKGDLDTIVLKALSKAPQDRYPTADAFGQDIGRYLRGEPVLARPESRWYRFGKFVKRNKLAVGLASAVCLAGIAVAAGAGIALYEARQAERRLGQVRELANRFVFDFEAAIRDTPGTLAARRMVAATARQYLATLVGDLRGDPALTREFAEAYYRLSQAEFSAEESGLSTEHLYESLGLLRRQRGGCCRGTEERFLLIRALSDLGRNLENAGNLRESLASTTEAVTRAHAWLAASPREPLAERALVIALLDEGSVLRVMGRLSGARQADAEALTRAEALLAANSRDTEIAFDRVQGGHSLAVVERDLGNYPAARDIESEAIEVLDGMLKHDPANIRWRQWRVRTQSTLSTLLVKLASRNPTLEPQVLPAMRLAYQLARENVERNPGDNRLVDDLVIMTDRLARQLGSVGRAVEGLALMDESRSHAVRLVQVDPDVSRNRLLQENILQLQGELLMEAGRFAEADGVLAEAERSAADASTRWPDNMELQNDRVTTLSYRVTLAIRRGEYQAARQRCRLGLSLAQDILQKSSGTFTVDALRDLRAKGRQLGLADSLSPATPAR
jgi:serine/threonine protein kinase